MLYLTHISTSFRSGETFLKPVGVSHDVQGMTDYEVNNNLLTYAADRSGTVQTGCRPRIWSLVLSLTVNGTIVLA